MSAPGWYPDPDGSRRLRYFDGRQWTPHTADPPLQGPPFQGPPQGNQQPFPQQPFPQQQYPQAQGFQQAQQQTQGYQQYGGGPQGPPGDMNPPPRGTANTLGWVALAVVVAMIIGVATWLVFFRDSTPTTPPPVATQSVTEPANTGTPSNEPAEPPVEPSTTPADPPASGQGIGLPEKGAVIEGLAGCPTTASDAIAEVGENGRYASGAGLDMPSADGFSPTVVQIPWMHQSNSQAKAYENNWIGFMSVGALRAEDGFTQPLESAMAMVACLAGSEFYAGNNPVATVIGADGGNEQGGVTLAVEVTVDDVSTTPSDQVLVVAALDQGVVHTFVAVTPTSDAEAQALVPEIASDLTLP